MNELSHLAAIAAEAVSGRMADPFAVFGPHETDDGIVVRSFQPGADSVELLSRDGKSFGAMKDIGHGLFVGNLPEMAPYRLRITWPTGTHETEDPYSFGLLIGDVDMYLFGEGRHWDLGHNMGAKASARSTVCRVWSSASGPPMHVGSR